LTGVGTEVYGEGYHLKLPLIERPIIYEIRARPQEISSLTGSKDLQMIKLTVRILYKPDAKNLADIYRNLGMNYDVRVLPSIGNEIMKAVVAQYTAAELLTQRRIVSAQIEERIIKRAQDFNIIIENVSITDTRFGKDYSEAVEAKQVAQQEADRAKYVVDQALQEKQAAIIKASGEAESITLVGEALKKQSGFLELRKIEAAKEIADVMSDPRVSHNRIFLNSDNLLLNLEAALNVNRTNK
jgi:prohibitin 2